MVKSYTLRGILPWRKSDIGSSITIYSIMPWCCLFGCSESGENGGTIHILIKNKWVVKCYRSDKFDYTTARVCNRHFEKKDYDGNLKCELLCLPIPTNQIKLLEDAVPSLCLALLASISSWQENTSCFGR